MVNKQNIRTLTEKLHDSEKNRKVIEQPTELFPDLSVDNAYNIQLENVKRKQKEGLRVTGKKIGLTSKSMQKLLGVGEPDYGHLLNDMEVVNGGTVPPKKLIQPKVEGEIAFILHEDIKGPGVTMEQVLNATKYIVPSIEIVDSRVKDWKIKLEDTIADNASSGLYVLGDTYVSPNKHDLSKLKMDLYKNGRFINSGTGADVLGNPAICVAWLANRLAHYNISLKAGEVILSGALSEAIEGEIGDVFEINIDKLGTVSVKL